MTVVIQETVKHLEIARVSDCTTAFQLLYQPTVVHQSVERTSRDSAGDSAGVDTAGTQARGSRYATSTNIPLYTCSY